MDNGPVELPRPAMLQGALRKVTEQLACELSRPSAAAPDWTDFEWRLARAAASIHGVSALLATRLNWRGAPGWRQFIEEQRAHVLARQLQIEDFMRRLDTRSRDAGIALVGLKGVALHAQGFYRAGERPMADIDLLARPQDMEAAGRVLESLGMRESFANWKHKVFSPEHPDTHAEIGEHRDNYLKVDLHERIAEVLPLRLTEVTRAVFPGHAHPGLNGYPTIAALLIHLLIHAAGAMASRSLRLLHLHDIALVSARMSPADWRELGELAGGPWWALPPLRIVARYYGTEIPADVLQEMSARCQWSLRRWARRQTLSDVSMSYLWIEAFPGIEWSRTFGEMMQYVRTRIRPSRELLHLREIAADTQAAMKTSEWGRMSQRRRMLRWLTSRPTRPDAVYAVQYALRQAP